MKLENLKKQHIILLIIWASIMTVALLVTVIFNYTVQVGNIKFSPDKSNHSWMVYSKTIGILKDKQYAYDEKKEQQIKSTKDIVKKIKTEANSIFKKEMIDCGINFSYDNPIYKSYVHMFDFVVDIAEDDAIARIIEDLKTYVKKNYYDYEYYKIDFEKIMHTPITTLLNQVRENVQKEWVDIKDEDTGILITSSANYEYMDEHKMKFYILIQSVFVEAFKIELKYSKIMDAKDDELKSYLELLGS